MTSRNTLQGMAVLATVLTASSIVLLSGCKSGGPPPGAGAGYGPMPVQVTTAAQQDVPLTGEWVATTDGFVNAQIQPQVSGYLVRQDYKEGSEVRKGQVLFEIDPRPLKAVLDQAVGQLDQSKGQLAQAQAQLELAGINVNRDTPLAQEHAIAQSALDNDLKTQQADQANVASAQAGIAAAQANVEAAELNVGFTKVRSLIDGVAGQAALQVGNLVNTTSILTSISQLNPIKVYFYISEQEYLTLSAQAKARGKSDILSGGNVIPLKLNLANNQVYPHIGHIIFVDRAVSAQTGSIRVAAEFANPGNFLRPGQFGRISAETTVLHNAVVVPQRAVSELQGMNQVIVVGSDNVAHIRTVQLGTQIGPNIVIASGLTAGDHVVTQGNDKVKDGMKVVSQPDTTPAPTAAAGQNAQGN
ncbi:MAG: efflux RND transporter periplasmic adaptor subunit [Acidobacteriota bacterium]|nr:efflux RND transporter periplasmic adaptor subunit [Acidobacteriota bacterium]